MGRFNLTWKIWLMLSIIAISVFSLINFTGLFYSGVVITSLDVNSTAATSGLQKGDIITHVNEISVENRQDFAEIISSLFESQEEEVKVVFDTRERTFVFFTEEIPEISVKDLRKTNIQVGLDLQGGARALVRPEADLNDEQIQDLISVSTERLNVYGISDVNIRPVRDLQGNKFMLVEIAGATPEDIESLIGQQGKFEARISNETVFTGGNKEITYVCRNDGSCASVTQCFENQNGWFCNYEFVIHLSEVAAKRHANITSNLEIDQENLGYLEEQIEFYVDDTFSTSLFISEGLRGLETTQIQIRGSGQGIDRESAFNDAETSMKQMQTILITGSLPYKLNIEKLDTISPILGKKFINLIFLTAIVALLLVSTTVFIRYKNFKASLALLFTGFSEIVILLGVASIIKWNLDLPSIVGILVMIGTGVDQQIILLDESSSEKSGTIRQKLSRGIKIVMAAYFTTLFSLLPLWYAGAGLMRGFMVTTIIGLTIGVFITRPAFADMLKNLDRSS